MTAPLLTLVLSSVAHASSWSSFAAAFPTNPCPDGWAACVVAGDAVDAEPRADEGPPQPADLRVGWFDLRPTQTFSPFDDLSARAAPGAELAPIPEPAATRPRPASSPGERPASAPGTPASPPPPAHDDGAAAVDGGPAQPSGQGEVHVCDDLDALEQPAMVGALSGEQQRCLEEQLAATPRMTRKDEISRLLMSDAFARGDRDGWEQLVKRHLDGIDQSDPDLCFKYALYLAGQGPERAPAAMRWASVALENRSVWTGATYTRRVAALYKLRAASAQALWQSAEAEHARAPSSSTGDAVDQMRALTKVQAREWLDYARAAGLDTSAASALCASAAGTQRYCQP